MSNNRLEYIDVAKGILICLVVVGHILNIATYQLESNEFIINANKLETLYKGFYMCAFFVITGYCSNFNKTFCSFTKSNLRTIVLPAFSLFYITQTINLLFAGEHVFFDYLHFDFHAFFIEQGLSAWFLASLFVARNVYWCSVRVVNSTKYRFILFAVLYVLGYILSHRTHNYWSYQQALMFLIFMEYGQFLKMSRGGCFYNWKLIVCLIAYLIMYIYTYKVLDNSIVGIHRIISLSKATLLSNMVIAICGSYIILHISYKIRENYILQYFGRNSLIIYLLNWDVIAIFMNRFHPLLGSDYVTNIICYTAIFLLTCAFCVMMINLLNMKYIRILIGKK